MTNPTYHQLDKVTHLQLIRNRIRDLETQKLQLDLRLNSPAPGDAISQQDRDNLQQLVNGLEYLYKQETELDK